MELTNGSDLILILKLEDKKGQPLRVKDCVTFKVRVWTSNRADCLVFYKTQINQIGEYDRLPIDASDLNKLQSGVICYDYDYSVYDPNFETDMKYDKVKEVVTDFYWRNQGIEDGNGEVTYGDLTRVYEKLSAEEDTRMAEDYKLTEAINWLNLNACLKGSCSVIKDQEGNIIREFVVGEDVDPTYTQEEIDEMIAVINDHIDEVETNLFGNIKEVEGNLFGNIEEVQKNLVETVATVQQGLHNEIVDELNRATQKEAELDTKIDNTLVEAKSYTDTKFAEANQYSDQKNDELKLYADNKFDKAREYVDSTFETKNDAEALESRIENELSTLEAKHNNDIAETLKDAQKYTDTKVKDLQHNVEDNYYNREYVDNLESDIRNDIKQAKSDANKYTDSKLIHYYTREEADNLHSNALSDLNNKLLGYYKKGETDALLEALEAEIDDNFKNYYNKAQVNNLLADVKEQIPTAVSQLDNDLGYLTRHQSLALYAKTADVQNWIKDSEDYIKEYYQVKGDYATVDNVKYMIERLINTAPEALDTLGEIAEKLKSNDDLHASLIDLLRRKANQDMVYTKSETDKMFRDAILEIQNGFSLELVNYFTQDECNARFQPIGDYALKSDIPSLSGYATEAWVKSQNYLTQHQDLSDYATKNWVENKNYLTQHQDLSAYALKSYVDSKVEQSIGAIPEFDGYTKTESDGKYALKGDIPSLDGYAKTSEVQQMIETTVEEKIQEIPQVDSYTKAEADGKFQLKGNYLTSLPDTVATKEYVDQQIDAKVSGGDVDLSNYYTKTQSDGKYQPKGEYLTQTSLTGYQKTADAVKIWSGSQSQYDQLGSYDNNTVYIIIG